MMIPKTIGPWTIGELIEKGGQAGVYEATRGEGGAIHALKLVITGTPKKRSRFAQEVQKHAELSAKGSTNIIPIVDHNLEDFAAGERNGYIVMPKAETTLEKERELIRLRLELCLQIFRGIVCGIREAHAINIIHRDLKPSNVLFLDRSLRTPLISDFGICFVKGTPDEERITGAHETVGAKFFMAPEQERGGVTDVREAADLYTLGKLLHFMLTGRYLYREKLEETFEEWEISADSRLQIVQKEILACTIVEDADRRIQSANELLKVVDRLLGHFGTPTNSGLPAPGSAEPVAGSGDSQVGRTGEAYLQVVRDLDEGRVKSIRVLFDSCWKNFENAWTRIRGEIERRAEEAPKGARELIRLQPQITGYTLAMARLDAHELFPDFKNLLESITRSSEGRAGYVAVHSVPHVLAGFLYMAASVAALSFQSWEVLARLLRSKFEWYYRSGRPLYSFGFEHTYFFHPEALSRKASDTHDLFREELSRPELLDLLRLTAEELLDRYVQTHMIMCLRGAQELQAGEDFGMFADFGRFYEHRVIQLLDRVHNDHEYAVGLCKAFGETPDEWFSRLNDRLAIVRKHFWRSSGFFWESLSSYEPR